MKSVSLDLTKMFFSDYMHGLCFVGVKLSSLLGKKGSLDKLQSYWDVGFFLGASILACDNTRVIQASEKLFKIKAPIWYQLTFYTQQCNKTHKNKLRNTVNNKLAI